jgi:hypothetical protein
VDGLINAGVVKKTRKAMVAGIENADADSVAEWQTLALNSDMFPFDEAGDTKFQESLSRWKTLCSASSDEEEKEEEEEEEGGGEKHTASIDDGKKKFSPGGGGGGGGGDDAIQPQSRLF